MATTREKKEKSKTPRENEYEEAAGEQNCAVDARRSQKREDVVAFRLLLLQLLLVPRNKNKAQKQPGIREVKEKGGRAGETGVAEAPCRVVAGERDEADHRVHHQRDAHGLVQRVQHAEAVERLEHAQEQEHGPAARAAPAAFAARREGALHRFHRDQDPEDDPQQRRDRRDRVALHVLRQRGRGLTFCHRGRTTRVGVR